MSSTPGTDRSQSSQTNALTADQSPTDPSPVEDKRHQLTTPTPLSSVEVRTHLKEALSAVATQRRLAVFEPNNTVAQQTLVVTNDKSSEDFALQRLESGVPETGESLDEAGVISALVPILTTSDRRNGGEFYTKPAVGGIIAADDLSTDQH